MSFSIIDYPKLRPAKCLNCGNGYDTRRRYIDTKRDVIRYGRIYFCNFCIAEMARAMGFVSQDEVEEMKIQLGGYEKQIKEIHDENLKLRISLDNLDFIGHTVDGTDDSTEILSRVERVLERVADKFESDEQNNISDIAQRNRETKSAKQRSIKPDAEPGPTDVLADVKLKLSDQG